MSVPPPGEQLAKACRTAQLIGVGMIVSLGIYAFVIRVIQQTHAPFGGFAPGVPHHLLRWVFGALALAALGLTRVVQRSILANTALPLLGRVNTAAIVALALCEAIAIYGFVLFLLAGRTIDYYLFAALALVGFIFYFPRREAWEEQARALARDAAGRGITPRT